MNKANQGQILAWSLVAAVLAASIYAWGGLFAYNFKNLSIYLLFPLLGLVAFGVMWTHYMMVAYRTYYKLDKPVLANYFRWTGYVVLGLICLHPGLLIYQRLKDGYGLPPHSYESYVAPGLGWLTILGSASLLVFLAFELRRFLGDRPWWHYVADASDLAMLAIVYHALRLGSNLQQGWFKYVWLVYAITLVMVLTYKYANRYQHPSPSDLKPLAGTGDIPG